MYYLAVDAIGRTWKVEKEAVEKDYIDYIIQDDGLSLKEAKEFLQQVQSSISVCQIDTWWYEQVLPYPEIVMHMGVMVSDIDDEKKQSILERIACREMSYLETSEHNYES